MVAGELRPRARKEAPRTVHPLLDGARPRSPALARALRAIPRVGSRRPHMTRSREEAIQQDVQDLHRLGYAQELFRSMGGFSNFAISFSIISILTGAVILYDYGLAWAGTAASLIG